MNDQPDPHETAYDLIRRFGGRATTQAARRAADHLAAGRMPLSVSWLRIAKLVDTLQSVEFGNTFSRLRPDERDALLAGARRRTYEPGAMILEQGQAYAKTLGVVAEGRVRVLRRLNVRASYRVDKESGRVAGQRSGAEAPETRVELARLGEGAIFGELSFLDQDQISADVVAETTAAIQFIDGDEIAGFMARDAGFAGRFYQSLALTLSRRVRATNKMIV